MMNADSFMARMMAASMMRNMGSQGGAGGAGTGGGMFSNPMVPFFMMAN